MTDLDPAALAAADQVLAAIDTDAAALAEKHLGEQGLSLADFNEDERLAFDLGARCGAMAMQRWRRSCG